jgi:hypothetical protein
VRRRLAAALLISAALAAPASASNSSLSGYSDVGGEAQSGVTPASRVGRQAPSSAVGGVNAAAPARVSRRSGGDGGGLPFTGYDALLFGGVGLTLMGFGLALRVLVGQVTRRGAG